MWVAAFVRGETRLGWALKIALGISLQQLERYEAGASRIGAEKLKQISEILQAPLSFFIEAFSASQQPTLAAADFKGDRVTESSE